MAEQIMHAAGVLMMLAEGYFFYQILSCLMEPRKPLLFKGIGIIFCSALVSVIIYANDPANITYMLPVFFLLTYAAFRADWLIRFSVIMLFYPIIIAFNFVHGETFGGLAIYWFGEGTAGNSILFDLSFIVPVLFWFFYWRVLRKNLSETRDFLDARSWIFLDIVCLASMAAVYSCIYYTPRESFKVIPCMLACMVTNMGSIRLAADLADRVRGELERKNLKVQQDYYEELENSQLKLRKFRHDMKNHLAAAGELLREGREDKAREYLGQLSGYMDTSNRLFCKVPIVNAVLNVKYNAALENDIDCFFGIGIDGMAGLDNISLCAIFSNTLDNAIEACKKIPDVNERRLSVKARYTENGYFSYEIVNAKVNEVRRKRGRFLTDKEDGKSHGLGISSVKEIVDRYKGTMDISYTEKEFSVVILVEVS